MTVNAQCGTDLFHEVLRDEDLTHWLSRMEVHDADLVQHSLLAGATASEFCRFVPMTPDEQRLLVTGALLHDVGKLSVSRETLQKRSPLTRMERETLERHPELGVTLLHGGGWQPEILEMVHLHHERMDGSGYPHGLTGRGISRLVRMLMICDVFCALIEARSYRPSLRRPIEIMGVMADEFDESLLRIFSEGVPDLAYRAQRMLTEREPVVAFAHP